MGLFKKHIADLSDQDLLIQYKNQHKTIYMGELYKRYSHLVLGICLKYLKNKEDSKDAVIQIFEQLLTEVLKHDIHNFSSWLHSVSRNYCLMQLRKRKIETTELKVVYLKTEEEEKEEKIEKEKEYEALSKAIEQLKEEQKECIKLFYLEEKSYQEITKITSYNLKQIKSFIQNGKRNLKLIITNEKVA